jgi:hypothetical protein
MSRADKITSKSVQDELYADFLLNLDLNPISGEISRVTNEKAVIRAMKNLIQTNPGERVTSSTIGCGLKRLLFEPFDDVTTDLIRTSISTTINQWEPRVNLLLVDVRPNQEANAYLIYVTFSMVNAPSQALQFSTVLKRVR